MPLLSLLGRGALAVAVCLSLPAQTRWTTLLGTGPGVRSDIALTYDSTRERTVLTGGWDGAINLPDVWEFDGTAWTARPATGGPGPHSSHALAYDASRQKVVLFGGWDGTSILDATWEWDGATGTWTQRQPALVPPARYGHQLTYDPTRQRVVMFGGYCGTGCVLADTWEWDGSAGTWTQRTPATAPPGRYSFGMCFDTVQQRVLLFGGRLLSTRGNDTWAWDGGAGTWTQLAPAGALPALRSTQRLVFDSARGRAVMFGGYVGFWANDTWEFDGTAWQQRTPVGAPSGRGFFGMEFDRARAQTVVYGGDLGGGPVSGTHLYAPITPAQALPFGVACPPRANPPALQPSGATLPWLGQTFTLEARHLSTASPGAVLALGASATAWAGFALPLDLTALGMTSCSVQASPDLTLAAPVQSGVAAWALPVPIDVGLLGGSAFAQAFAIEVGANPFGMVATHGLRIVFGGL